MDFAQLLNSTTPQGNTLDPIEEIKERVRQEKYDKAQKSRAECLERIFTGGNCTDEQIQHLMKYVSFCDEYLYFVIPNHCKIRSPIGKYAPNSGIFFILVTNKHKTWYGKTYTTDEWHFSPQYTLGGTLIEAGKYALAQNSNHRNNYGGPK